MIDHVSLYVTSYSQAKPFYEAALAPLGYSCLKEFEGKVGGFGEEEARLWVIEDEKVRPSHIAFQVKEKEKVDAFYAAALLAGGKDNGPPGPRPQYAENYYAAFVFDPDGHNIEVVCRETL